MKRCSQCDFIYEDDQNLCDMDGHELVYEPTLHGLQGNTTTAASKPDRPAKATARRRALAVGAAVLVGTLLFVGYSGLTREDVPQTTKAPSTNVIRPTRSVPDQSPATPNLPAQPSASEPLPGNPNVISPRQSTPDQTPTTPSAPTPSPSNSPRLEKTRAKPTTGSPLASSTPSSRSTTATRDTMRSDSTKENHKKDSGIGGFLKKTGKILKRPFKF